jgi:DNA repair exonuclease SbcCD ATPase subunit
MSGNLISSTAVNRLNTIASTITEIINKQKGASQAIQQLNPEYNALQKEHEKRDKLLKENLKIRDKLAILQVQRIEQEKKLKKYTKRRKELESLEESVRDNEAYFQDLQF